MRFSTSLYYPKFHKVSELSTIPLDKKFTVHFTGAVDWQSVNSTNLELINSETGERTLSTYVPIGLFDVQVIPKAVLTPNTTYWLVIHPLVHDVNGRAMSEGAVAVAHTIEAEAVTGPSKIQSIESNKRLNEHTATSPHDPDYGLALWDLGARRSTRRWKK